MFGFKLVTESEYEKLTEDVSYWRDKSETERKRADRFQEKVLQLNGMPPITEDEGSVETHPRDIRKRLEAMMGELLKDEIVDEAEEEFEVLEVAPAKE